jgi:hypothetical protein
MRRVIMTWAGAATLSMVTAFATPVAQAMTIAAPAGLARAPHVANLVQDVRYVCGWWGRRCWTIGYGYYYRPYYVYSYPHYWPYYRPYAYHRAYAY